MKQDERLFVVKRPGAVAGECRHSLGYNELPNNQYESCETRNKSDASTDVTAVRCATPPKPRVTCSV